MSGSVEATTAIALPTTSSGTPASLMAAVRWPATAAKSSRSMPRTFVGLRERAAVVPS